MTDEKKLLTEGQQESVEKVDAENAEFSVNIDDLPAESADKTNLLNKKSPDLRQPDERLSAQDYLDYKYNYDWPVISFYPFVLSLALLAVMTQLSAANFVTNMSSVGVYSKSIGAKVIIGLMSPAITVFKFLFPVWAYLIFKKYPFKRSGPHQIKIDYKGIETMDVPTYPSNINRVFIPYSKISSYKFGENKWYPYIELFNENNASIGAIRWDIKNHQPLKKALRIFLDADHCLQSLIKA